MKVLCIVQTCASCPSQWEGYLDDGRAFYIRFRHGTLTMYAHVNDPLSVYGETIIDSSHAHLPATSEIAFAIKLLGVDGELLYNALRSMLSLRGIESPTRMEDRNRRHRHIVPALDFGSQFTQHIQRTTHHGKEKQQHTHDHPRASEESTRRHRLS